MINVLDGCSIQYVPSIATLIKINNTNLGPDPKFPYTDGNPRLLIQFKWEHYI